VSLGAASIGTIGSVGLSGLQVKHTNCCLPHNNLNLPLEIILCVPHSKQLRVSPPLDLPAKGEPPARDTYRNPSGLSVVATCSLLMGLTLFEVHYSAGNAAVPCRARSQFGLVTPGPDSKVVPSWETFMLNCTLRMQRVHTSHFNSPCAQLSEYTSR
jgi:hypothetical protein